MFNLLGYCRGAAGRFLLISTFLTLSSCGGGGGGGTSSTGGGTNTYSVSVLTSGLTGTGLQVGIASSASTEIMNITANGTRSFPTGLPEGTLYTVGIGSQPGGQSCSIGGSFFSTNITENKTVTVSCTDVQTIGGNISGLSGDLELRLNSSNTTTFNTNGSFSFSNQLASGDYYAVTVNTQPVGQTCLVSNSAGLVGASSVTDVSISCTTSSAGYQVGGYISGFSGLAVMNLNGVEEVARTYNGSFTFSTPLATGTAYSVSVSSITQGYECTVVNPDGVIADSDYPFIDINCNKITGTDIFPLVNPDGAYLDAGETITLSLNGTEDMTLDSWDWDNVAFKTALSAASAYEVTVKTPPVGEVCILSNSVGTIESGVTPVIGIDCVSDTNPLYTIGGAITGLTGTGLELSLDGRETLAINATDTAYIFPDAQPNFTGHTVSVKTQPSGQLCSITNDSFSIFSGNIGNASVICSPGPYSVGGYAAGVKAPGLAIQLSGTETIDLPLGGDFVFNTLLSDGMDYDVKIISQPTDQLCTLQYGSGVAISASRDNLVIDCKDIDYSVAVHVTGYVSTATTPLLLQLNGAEVIQASSNTSTGSIFAPEVFSTRLPDTANYIVSIAGQPEGQTCSITNPSGTINAADAYSTGVYCVSDTSTAGPYDVNITTSGLLGNGLVLQLNAANDLAVSVDGYTSFAASLTDNSSYNVTVLNQPQSPIQHCEVINGSGTITAANITNISVQCGNGVKSLYPVNGSRWLDYVKNDGLNTLSATDTACDTAVDNGGYTVCLNGAEFMQVNLPALSSCLNITATDNLNAFNWVCDNSNGIRVISNGLKATSNLSGLVDFDAVGFKPNFVSILDNGVNIGQTQASVWWDNPVIVNNTGEFINSGDIVLVTGSVPAGIEMLNKTAVLVQPGFAIAAEVFADTKDFLWFEGDINSSSLGGLSYRLSNFSVAQNIQSLNNANSGLFLFGSNNRYKNITANNNGGIGADFSGTHLVIDNITANGNFGSYGVDISASNSTISNITASDNSDSGFYLVTSGDINLNNVTANNNGSSINVSGIVITGSGTSFVGPQTISNLQASNNSFRGIFIDGLLNSSITDLSANLNGDRGIELSNSDNASISNLSASTNGDFGIRIHRWKNSAVNNLQASNNGLVSALNGDTIGLDGVNIHQSEKLVINNVISNNNARHGYALESNLHTISSNILASNNTGSGIAYLDNDPRNILIGASSGNNSQHGLEIIRTGFINISSLITINNGGNGIHTETFVNDLIFSNLVNTNNTGYGFLIGHDNGHYTGLLNMGTNGLGDCKLGPGILDFTGITQGGNNVNNLNNECVLNNTSDGSLIPLVDASSTLVAKVITNDTVNGDDDLTPGTASFNNITNWNGFENSLRAWGIDGVLAFAGDDNQGSCNTPGDSCRIWDWSLSASDAGNSGLPAALNVVALPSATDTLSMVWTSTAGLDQAYCDTTYPGSIWDGLSTCTSTYLRHAQEIYADNIGNDNGLCEVSETCLYMPNIGRYQGHGLLVPAGSVGSGADTISLMKYDTLGR